MIRGWIAGVVALPLLSLFLGTEGSAQSRSGVCSITGPVFSVGGMMDPDHLFGDISDASMLSDSSIAVLDRQAYNVQIFDASGRLVRTLGREGKGPGEFVDAFQVEASGSTIAVWDWGNRRVTTFDLRTDSAKTVTVRGLLNPHGPFGLRSSGGFAFGETTRVAPMGGEESWMMHMAVVLTAPSGADPDTVLEIPHREAHWVDRSISRLGFPMFSPAANMAVSAGTIWVARGDSARLVRIGSVGIDTVQWDWPLRRVRPIDEENQRKSILAASRPERLRLWNLQFEKLPVSEFFPAVAELAPDIHGGVWVGSYSRPGDQVRRWARIEDEGVVCELDLPASFTVMEGARTWVLGVATDDFDVQRVELWSVKPAARDNGPALSHD